MKVKQHQGFFISTLAEGKRLGRNDVCGAQDLLYPKLRRIPLLFSITL